MSDTKKLEENLREDVQKCLSDPIYSLLQNFSLEKSEEYYRKWEEAWNSGQLENNPAVVVETEAFPFTTLEEMITASQEASTFMTNIEKSGFFKDVERDIYAMNIVVDRYRLKTYDEWLHDGLRDALCQAYKTPEDGARMIIERALGAGKYRNVDIHLFVEGKINVETLKRLGQYEDYKRIEGRDINEDIVQVRKALEDMRDNNTVEEICEMLKRKGVSVLKLKM